MTQASCHTCIYACWDLGQALLSMSTGFASRPMCANQPEAPARMQPTPVGAICRNYRPKPPTPQGDVKQIPLGGGMYAYVDAADYEWLSQYNWSVYGGGYAARTEKGRFILMHREIMQPPEGMIVDHIDGNKANNCRFNLRVCTPAENRYNCSKRNGTSSRFKGVGYRKDIERYCARLRHKGELIWLGYFDEEEEAARVYDRAAVEYRGPFARVNFPEEWPPERVQQVYAEYQANPKREVEKGVRSEKGAKARKERGKRRAAGARRRRAGQKKARKPEGRKAGRTRDASRTTSKRKLPR